MPRKDLMIYQLSQQRLRPSGSNVGLALASAVSFLDWDSSILPAVYPTAGISFVGEGRR